MGMCGVYGMVNVCMCVCGTYMSGGCYVCMVMAFGVSVAYMVYMWYVHNV